MTQRTKTIEYACPLATASVASTVSRAFTQIAALAIPESTSRTFRSVIMEVSYMDNDAAAAGQTAILMGVQLAAVAFSDVVVTQTIANSGEQNNHIFSRDITSYFVTNYTGTTMTCDLRMTVTGKVTCNATCKLIITYEYDDSGQTTQIKTVRIPVDGNIGILTTSFANIGTTANQIPLLDQFLPEMSKTYRCAFFEQNINQGTVAAQATNPTLDMRYDGATTISDLAHEDALASDTFYRRIDLLIATHGAGMTTNAAHSVESKVTQTAASQAHACQNGVLVVTYEYNATIANLTLNEDLDNSETGVDVTSAAGYTAPFAIQIDDEFMICTSIASNTLTVTRGAYGSTAASHTNGATVYMAILNSLVLPCIEQVGWTGGTATGDKSRQKVNVSIQEPGVPRLAQSGVMCSFIAAGTATTDFRAGGQATRSYVSNTGAKCGGSTFLRRIDVGETGGVAAITLARGMNTITFDWFDTSATAGNVSSSFTGVLFLNYYSRRHTSGVGVHNHSTAWCILPYSASQLVPRYELAAARVPVIPETTYYVNNIGHEVNLEASGAVLTTAALAVHFELQSGEGEEAGWRNVLATMYTSDVEIGSLIMFGRHRPGAFYDFASDPDTNKANPETARNYRYDVNINTAATWFSKMWLTYHAITYSIAGDITDSGGGTVTIQGHLNADFGNLKKGCQIASTSRSGNGAYSMTWYDNTVDIFTEARESGTLIGRSDNGVAE